MKRVKVKVKRDGNKIVTQTVKAYPNPKPSKNIEDLIYNYRIGDVYIFSKLSLNTTKNIKGSEGTGRSPRTSFARCDHLIFLIDIIEKRPIRLV